MYLKTWSVVFITTLFIFILAYIYIFKDPSNNRNWEIGYRTLSQVTVNGDEVQINNIRDGEYKSDGSYDISYYADKFNARDLSAVWFVVEPFSKWDGIAHTYFIFDFNDQRSIAVSVEARREIGEDFNAFVGLFNNFELMYIWGTEKDITGRRVMVEKTTVYMYPLSITEPAMQQLFLKMAKETNKTESTPQFYNTLTNNCTNILAKNANEINPGSVPFNISWFLPGFSEEYLYNLGYIDNIDDLQTIRVRSNITDLVQKFYNSNSFDFSQTIRRSLIQRLYQQ